MAAIEPIKLEFLPGLVRSGTVYQTPAGRFYDGNLIRFDGQVRKPMKGWATGLAGTLTGNPRCAFAWKDNDGLPFAAFGTHSALFAHDGSTLDDITPSGFVAGDANASQWTIDNFGELLVACNDANEAIYEWQPGGGGDATVITNSPDALSVVVTPERFPFALGADGDPRRVAFPDGENRTVWTPSTTNRAREILLQTPGVLMCGARVSGGTLIWTTHDIHFARYIGLPDVYQIKPVGNQCGIVGKHAYATVDQLAYWMGENNFWVWAGYAEPLPCEISDDIFKNINQTHRHKVWCEHRSAEGEIWFNYPRGDATECSHAAIYCYRAPQHWNHVELARNCGFEAGAFSWPVRVTSAGAMLKHETGWNYSDDVLLLENGDGWLLEDGSPWQLESAVQTTRNLISGPFEISNGGGLLLIDEIIPDELTQGDCEVYFHVSEYPTDGETTFGPFTAGDRIPIEVPARKIRMEIRAAAGVEDFRIGTYRAVVKEWSAY